MTEIIINLETGGEKGQKGDKGDRGEPGLRGLQGNRGVPGLRGERGPMGQGISFLGILESTDDLPNIGAQGDGYFVDTDLHVYIGNGFINLGQVRGPQGETGLKGDTGDQGIQGIQGVQGVKGDTGDTGPVGPMGDITPEYHAFVDKLEEVIENKAVPFIDQVDEDLLFAVKDDNDRATAIAARQSDGMFPDFVIRDIEKRLNKREIRKPVLTDTSTLVVWGASDVKYPAAFSQMASELGITYVDKGNGGAHADSIWHQQGSYPALFQFNNNTIPANDTLTTHTWLNGVNRGAIGPHNAYIEGTDIYGRYQGNRFGRRGVVPGLTEPVLLNGPVRMISFDSIKYSDCMQIWSIGRNDLSTYTTHTINGESVLIEDYIFHLKKRAYENLPTVDKKVLVLGSWPQVNHTPTSIQPLMIRTLNMKYKLYFKERYVDLLTPLLSPNIWSQTGLDPSADDLAKQTAGIMPQILFNDAVHPKDVVMNALVQNVIKPRLIALNWLS